MTTVHLVWQNDSVLAVHATEAGAVDACKAIVRQHETTYMWQKSEHSNRWFGRSKQAGDFPIHLGVDKWEVRS